MYPNVTRTKRSPNDVPKCYLDQTKPQNDVPKIMLQKIVNKTEKEYLALSSLKNKTAQLDVTTDVSDKTNMQTSKFIPSLDFMSPIFPLAWTGWNFGITGQSLKGDPLTNSSQNGFKLFHLQYTDT